MHEDEAKDTSGEGLPPSPGQLDSRCPWSGGEETEGPGESPLAGPVLLT